MLEITILLGTDIEWATGSTGGAAIADPPVLASGAAADDEDASDSQDSDAQVPGGSPAAGADPNDGGDAGRGAAADDDGGGGGGTAADDGGVEIDTDGVVLDMGDFTTKWITTRSSSRQTPCSASDRFGPTLRWQSSCGTTLPSVKSTPVRGMASPRRGRPPFTTTFALVTWISGWNGTW